jgi:hypothetical protein
MQSGGGAEEPPSRSGSGRISGKAKQWRRERQSNATSNKPSNKASRTLMSKLIEFKILGDHNTSDCRALKAAIYE